jgi:hypothetical protein
VELGGDGTIDGSPRDYLGSIAIAKWRLGIYLLSFWFLISVLIWYRWDYSGEIDLLTMSSLLPFFGWAVLPNVSGARYGAVQDVEWELIRMTVRHIISTKCLLWLNHTRW